MAGHVFGEKKAAEERVDLKNAIVCFWEFETQRLGLRFDPMQFKTWDMVIAVLEAALSEAKFKMNVVRMQQLQEQSLAAMQNQAVQHELERQKRVGPH